MKLLTLILVLAGGLAAQTGLGALWPESLGYADMMLVPVLWYAMAGSQRSGMLVGCAAGLLQDAWFQTGVFGISGFKKTALGWLLGGLSARFDVNRQTGRFVCGVLASLGDTVMDVGLRRLLDRVEPAPTLLEAAIRALVTGLLVVGAFGLVRRVRERRTGYRG